MNGSRTEGREVTAVWILWRRFLIKFVIALALADPTGPALAGEAVIAVASNFSDAMDRLQPEFERQHRHELMVSFGSTGKLYAQIVNGAPFDVFLSADQARPKRLVDMKLAVKGSRFTYAVGQLALWSADQGRNLEDGKEALRGEFRKLAIANPALAPYGQAADTALNRLGLAEKLSGKFVLGENAGQAFAFVASGNAELGLIALSQIMSPRNQLGRSHWKVPQELYNPIRQDAALLSKSVNNQAALAFLEFLRSEKAKMIIRASGYRTD